MQLKFIQLEKNLNNYFGILATWHGGVCIGFSTIMEKSTSFLCSERKDIFISQDLKIFFISTVTEDDSKHR